MEQAPPPHPLRFLPRRKNLTHGRICRVRTDRCGLFLRQSSWHSPCSFTSRQEGSSVINSVFIVCGAVCAMAPAATAIAIGRRFILFDLLNNSAASGTAAGASSGTSASGTGNLSFPPTSFRCCNRQAIPRRDDQPRRERVAAGLDAARPAAQPGQTMPHHHHHHPHIEQAQQQSGTTSTAGNNTAAAALQRQRRRDSSLDSLLTNALTA